MKRLTSLAVAVVFGLFLAIPQAVQAQPSGDQTVILETSKGRIVMRIFYSLVPYTAGSFLDLVSRGFYNGLSFHRVESWVVQGGDPNGNGSGVFIDPESGRPRQLKLEINRNLTHNQPGMVAMARGNNPNSASCQFYILKRAMPQLNNSYAVFGRVIDGMNIVYSMAPGDRIISATIASQQPQANTAASPPDYGHQPQADPRSAPASSSDSGF